MEIFVDLMKPMETGDMDNFEWVDAEKTALKPTKDNRKAFTEYSYTIARPDKVPRFIVGCPNVVANNLGT